MQRNTCGFTLWRLSIIVWTLEFPETLIVDPECLDVNNFFVESWQRIPQTVIRRTVMLAV